MESATCVVGFKLLFFFFYGCDALPLESQRNAGMQFLYSCIANSGSGTTYCCRCCNDKHLPSSTIINPCLAAYVLQAIRLTLSAREYFTLPSNHNYLQVEGAVIQGDPAVIFTLVGQSGQENYTFNFGEGQAASAYTTGSIIGETVNVTKTINGTVMTVTIDFSKSE